MTEDEIILTHILQCRAVDLVLDKPALTPAQQKQFEHFKARRQAGEPLQYILGTCNFMGLELKVNGSVLIPRPETEQLVDAAIKYLTVSFPLKGTVPFSSRGQSPSRKKAVIQILDLGTGSGNIAIALAKFVPQSEIVTVDVSAGALEVARANARTHGVEHQIEFIQGDMMESLRVSWKGWKGTVPLSSRGQSPSTFDLIISNPPYIPTEQLGHLPQDVQKEPLIALDGGEDGLNFYRIIIKYTPCLLIKGGCLMMEFGDGQAEPIKKLIEARENLADMEIIQDLAGRDRIIRAVLSS